MAVTRDPGLEELETDEAPRDPAFGLLDQDRASDEVTFRELHDPAETGLERSGRRVHVGPTERQACLETERVPGSEARGESAASLDRVQQLRPHDRRVLRRQPELAPVLPPL